VSLGGASVIAALRRAQQKDLTSGEKDHGRLEWIKEALTQAGKRLD